MSNSNPLKMNKLSKSDYHNIVVPAFVAYRKKMHKACNVKCGVGSGWGYARIFTEQRAYGARSKYWYTSKNLPVNLIESYVNANPTFTAGGVVYKVEARYVDGVSIYRRSPDFALFCNSL